MPFKHKSSVSLARARLRARLIVAVLAKQQCVAYPTGKLRLITASQWCSGIFLVSRLMALPSLVEKRPQTRTIHSVAHADDYAWLEGSELARGFARSVAPRPNNQSLLDAENSYAQHLGADRRHAKKLVAEMRARIKEEDSDVPVEDGPFLYYDRHRAGENIRLSAASRSMAAKNKFCSTAIARLRAGPILISAAHVLRPIIEHLPGAQTIKAPNSMSSDCAISKAARTAPRSSPTPMARLFGRPILLHSFMCGSMPITARRRCFSAVSAAIHQRTVS